MVDFTPGFDLGIARAVKNVVPVFSANGSGQVRATSRNASNVLKGANSANTPIANSGQGGGAANSALQQGSYTGTNVLGNRSNSGLSSTVNKALAGVYDSQLGRLNNYLGSLSGTQSAQENIVNGQYTQSRAALDTSRNRNLADLQTQQDQVQQNKVRSLNDLSNRGRNLMQALNNQFGTMGAGSSSASQVLAPYAIAQQQNRLGGDINQQVQEQNQAIDVSRNRLEQDYGDTLNQLEQEKMSNLLQIGQQFSDLSRQIQDQMSTANAAKASALGGAYRAAVSDANNQAAQIEQSYQAKLNDINNYYQNYHPTANTDLGNVDNNVQNLNTAGYSNIGVDPSATQEAVSAAYVDPKKDQNQLLY